MGEKIRNVQLPITQHIRLTPFSRSNKDLVLQYNKAYATLEMSGGRLFDTLIAMNEINSYSILLLRIRKRSKLWKFHLIFLTKN